MTGEYKTRIGWRIFIYIFSPLLIALFIFVGTLTFRSEFNLIVAIILIPVSVGGVILFTYGVAEAIVGRFIIGTNSLSQKTCLWTRTLTFAEIKGYKTVSNYVNIVPTESNKKGIQVSRYVEKSDQIVNWICSKFTDLDFHEVVEEEKQILENDEFGVTSQAREYKLNEARRVAKCINISGYAAFFWLVFYPRPYVISLSVGMILPAMSLISIHLYRGLIRFDEKKNSAYPSIVYGFLMPGIGVFIRALMDYEILDYNNLWFVTSLASLVLLIIVLSATKEIKFKKWTDYLMAASLGLLMYSYSFGTYLISNCLFDKSESQKFTSRVIDKEVSAGKTTTYYLKLDPWGPRTTPENVSVTKGEYEATNIGDNVNIYLRQGLLRTPWFYIKAD